MYVTIRYKKDLDDWDIDIPFEESSEAFSFIYKLIKAMEEDRREFFFRTHEEEKNTVVYLTNISKILCIYTDFSKDEESDPYGGNI